VFAHPDGGRLRADEWRRLIWRPAVTAAGLAPLRAHDLKHPGAALLAAAGVDPSEIARRAGHASVALLLRPVRPSPARGRQAGGRKLEVLRHPLQSAAYNASVRLALQRRSAREGGVFLEALLEALPKPCCCLSDSLFKRDLGPPAQALSDRGRVEGRGTKIAGARWPVGGLGVDAQ